MLIEFRIVPMCFVWLRISSDGDDRKIFLGLKFWVGKFGKYVFVWLDLSRECFGYKQSEGS